MSDLTNEGDVVPIGGAEMVSGTRFNASVLVGVSIVILLIVVALVYSYVTV